MPAGTGFIRIDGVGSFGRGTASRRPVAGTTIILGSESSRGLAVDNALAFALAELGCVLLNCPAAPALLRSRRCAAFGSAGLGIGSAAAAHIALRNLTNVLAALVSLISMSHGALPTFAGGGDG